MSTFPPLECTKVVYRTVFRKEWIRSDGSFKWQAFKPYRDDTMGVSSFIEYADIEKHADKPYFGVASVKVGRVRNCSNNECSLDVIQDQSWHANITGIPFPYQDDGSEDVKSQEKMRDMCAAVNTNASRSYVP